MRWPACLRKHSSSQLGVCPPARASGHLCTILVMAFRRNECGRQGHAPGRTPLRAAIRIAIIAAMATAPAVAVQAQDDLDELRDLSLEELGAVEITSVSKRPEPLSRAPAAVYVITSEDIRRSGAVSIPEVLRLAPNLHVARLNSFTYVITARGFSGTDASNKLLVMIDGRSVYTPLHGGVFWDTQHVLMDDIERIEVISGPGGTLWGANAVNGVINIITRRSADTQGGLVNLGLGTTDRNADARFGGSIGNELTYRAYATAYERNNTALADGSSAQDDWDGLQGGFRADWNGEDDLVTLQGDLYNNTLDGGGRNSGNNLIARWNRDLGDGSAFQIQAYYDEANRWVPSLSDSLTTYDLQGQHTFSLGRHQVVWGAGYRVTDDEFVNELNTVVLTPQSETIQLANLYAEDSVALSSDLTFTFGTKLEYSSYSGLEYLPSARLAWQATDTAMLWSAISRAVRTPSRLDRDLAAPGLAIPAPDFESETLIAYELGYRGQPMTDTLLSVSLYYNDYDEMRTLELSPAGGLPVQIGNGGEGHVYGVEVWGEYRVQPWWRLSAGFNALRKEFRRKTGSTDISNLQSAGNDPDYQFQVRSYMDLPENMELDLGLRSVDDLRNPKVPGYVELEARLGWRFSDDLEISLVGLNLLHDHHREIGTAEARRSLYLSARWRF
ncbi:MAG: TonB-dependent receptor plug domain-containing protein [Alphaproteobacteria bacterium]